MLLYFVYYIGIDYAEYGADCVYIGIESIFIYYWIGSVEFIVGVTFVIWSSLWLLITAGIILKP